MKYQLEIKFAVFAIFFWIFTHLINMITFQYCESGLVRNSSECGLSIIGLEGMAFVLSLLFGWDAVKKIQNWVLPNTTSEGSGSQ